MDAIKALLAQIQKFWAGKDGRFKRNAVIIAAVALFAIILSSVLLNHADYATLYTGMDPADSSAVIAALKAQKEPYQVSGDTILVPAKDADSLKMSLSGQIQSGFNLDILKQGQGLGMTESDKQDYRKYQIQEDLQKTFKSSLRGVKDATVAITMPTESVLVIDNNSQEATAGVILTLEDGVQLTSDQIKAIKSYLWKAVPGLKIENISLMDSNMQSLDESSADDLGTASDQYTLQNNVEAKLRKQVMALLLPIFGMGRVEAQVNVTLNFDDKTTDSVTYSPVVNDKDGVIVSYDKLREQIVNGDGTNTGQPGTASNTGTGTAPTYPAVNASNGTYEKTEDKVNLEVNSINEHLQQAKGSIKTLSVSVVIDNTDMKSDFTDNVKSLVKNAVGATEGNISVQYLPMAGSQALAASINQGTQAAAAHLSDQQNRFYIAIGAVVLVVLVAMLLMFMGRKARHKAELDQQTAILTAQAATAEEMRQMDDIQQMEDELAAIKIVKDSGTKEQIGTLIEKNPELVANLLRSWLADEQE